MRRLGRSIPHSTLKRWKRILEVTPVCDDGEYLYSQSDIDALVTLGKWLRTPGNTIKGFKRKYNIQSRWLIMSNVFDKQKASTQATAPIQPQRPKPNMPQASKVLAQHAIAKTQGNIAEIQKVGEMRTQVVLDTFDEVMAQSDRDIIEGLEARLGGATDSFFGVDFLQQMKGLSSASMLPAAQVEVLPSAQ